MSVLFWIVWPVLLVVAAVWMVGCIRATWREWREVQVRRP